jgi:hypothetical protein
MGAVDIVNIEVDIYIDNIDRTGESTREVAAGVSYLYL